VLGHPLVFTTPYPAWPGHIHYLSHLTSATTLYKGAKGKDAKAKILAETVNEIMAMAQEDTRALQMTQKGLSACLCFFITQSTDSGNCQ